MLKPFFDLLPGWVAYPLVAVLVFSGFFFLLLFVWGTLAALEKIVRVVRYGEPLSWTDPLYWLFELPGKTRKGIDVLHAKWLVNGYYDLRYILSSFDPFWYWTEEDKKEAERFLKKEGFL